MKRSESKDPQSEGYIYVSYGAEKFLAHAVASLTTLRRYDSSRPAILVCDPHHEEILRSKFDEKLFDDLLPLDPEHASITGFKHNLDRYMPFGRNLYLDSDIVWCKNPDPLWSQLSAYPFTITGILTSDHFFGGPKNIGVLKDLLLHRRKRTLKRFGLTHLSRIQSGIIYADDPETTRNVCRKASEYLSKIEETHFQSRKKERGREEESCEWSLAMAMSRLEIPVFPWLQGHHSPQLDFIESYVEYDPDFHQVTYHFDCDPHVYSFRGLRSEWLRKLLRNLVRRFPGKGDYLKVTPYSLHFGWLHQKQPFEHFSQRNWNRLTGEKQVDKSDAGSKPVGG